MNLICFSSVNAKILTMNYQSRASDSERGFGSLEWRQPGVGGSYAWPYAWPNMRETFRSCWGMVGEWPRPKNKFFR